MIVKLKTQEIKIATGVFHQVHKAQFFNSLYGQAISLDVEDYFFTSHERYQLLNNLS
jgi:hypothetical protein